MNAKLFAAIAAAAALAWSAGAQDDERPVSTTELDDGGARHDATGVECPGEIGAAPLIDILSFDRGEEHLGVSCLYGTDGQGAVTISVLRADVPELVGPGTSAQRWNRVVFRALAENRSTMPLAMGELGVNDVEGLRAGLFEIGVSEQGFVAIGIWAMDAGDWVIHSHAQFINDDDGRAMAAQTRSVTVAAAETIDG